MYYYTAVALLLLSVYVRVGKSPLLTSFTLNRLKYIATNVTQSIISIHKSAVLEQAQVQCFGVVCFSLCADLWSFFILLYPGSHLHLILPLSVPSIFREMLAFLATRTR